VIVALLDDGIDLYRCPGFSITHDLIVEESGAIRPRRAGEAVLTDHGTTCAQIIHTYAPEAEFCSLCIFILFLTIIIIYFSIVPYFS